MAARPAAENDAVLGIDVGTSATKAALYLLANGTVTGLTRVTHVTKSATALHVTQRPVEWYEAAVGAARAALQAERGVRVVAIAVTGSMQNLIAIGDEPPALLADDAVLYSDARAVAEAAAVSELTGAHVPATSILAKLALLPDPSTVPRYKLLLGAADFVVHRLCAGGSHATDATTASTTGLTQAPHRAYDATLLRAAGLASFLPLLPRILPQLAQAGTLSATAAAELSLPRSTHVIHCGGDAASATLGAGSSPYIYTGTSGWMGHTRASLPAIPSTLPLAHPSAPSLSLHLHTLPASGGVLTHTQQLLSLPTHQSLLSLSTHSPIGANNTAYVPFLAGTRVPEANPHATASFHHMTQQTTRSDICRAVLEGLAFAHVNAALLEHANGPITVCGGGASAEWAKVLAGALGTRVQLGARGDVGIRGAARAAAKCIGIQCAGGERTSDVFVPAEEEKQAWKKAYQAWTRCVGAANGAW